MEHRDSWWRIERIAWIISAVVLAAAVAGLFGRGPVGRGRITTPNGEIEYERIARYKTPAMIRVKLTSVNAHHLLLSRDLLDSFTLQGVLPQPTLSRLSPDGLQLDFAGTSGVVELTFECGKVGLIHGTISLDGAAPIPLRSFAVP